MCQGQTWHIMLRAGGFPWTKALRAGIARHECTGEGAPRFAERGTLQRRVNLVQFLRCPLDGSSGCKMEGTNPSSFGCCHIAGGSPLVSFRPAEDSNPFFLGLKKTTKYSVTESTGPACNQQYLACEHLFSKDSGSVWISCTGGC